MSHVRQTPGHLITQAAEWCLVYLSALTRKCSGGPSVPLSGKEMASSYSPHAAGSLAARRWPLCVSRHRGSSVGIARTGPC